MGDYVEYFRLMRRNAECKACCADHRPSPIYFKDNMTQNAFNFGNVSETDCTAGNNVGWDLILSSSLSLDCYWMVMILLVLA